MFCSVLCLFSFLSFGVAENSTHTDVGSSRTRATTPDRPTTLFATLAEPTAGDPTKHADLFFDPGQRVGGGRCVPLPHACHGRGLCVANRCHCFEQYGGDHCGVRQRAQRTAFFLSFFLGPFAAGRFYLGFLLLSLIKLCYSVIIFFVAARYFGLIDRDDTKPATNRLVSCIWVCGYVFWLIGDWVAIAAGYMTDFDGVGLYANM